MAEISFALIFLIVSISVQALTLERTYAGSTFFDRFYANESLIDADNYGNVHFLGPQDALTYNLTYVLSNGNAVVKVDNVTSGVGNPTFGRNTVRLLSNDSITIGTLVVMDAVHVPYGCSTWPAFWTIATSTQKSAQGEIDIFESVNNRNQNQMTLHTSSGCTQSNSTTMPYANTSVISTNCDHLVNENQGCAFRDSLPSAGAEFATNGGGVYAMLWDGDGIRQWFFPRASIPSDIEQPDPDNWPAPQAVWPASTCNPSSFFEPQTLVLGTNICGAFAGNAGIYAETCSGLCTDQVAEPSNYDNAYFEITYIKTFTGEPTSVTASIQSVSASDAVNAAVTGSSSSSTSRHVVSFIIVLLGLSLSLALA